MSENDTLRRCVFEYMYRDGGNWKTYGFLLLQGEVTQDAREAVRACCESGELFVAEQVQIPSLCEQHWIDCDDGPSDLDHAYHEFVDLRPASEDEAASLSDSGSLVELLKGMRAAAGKWDVRLSPNGAL